MSKIFFDESSHTYFHKESGERYESVSGVLGMFKQPFDADFISGKVAQKRDRISKEMAKKRGIDQKTVLRGFPLYERGITKKQVLMEWDMKRNAAADRGNGIHNALEDMIKRSIINPDYKNLCSKVWGRLSHYKSFYPEQIFYSEKHKVSGTADLPASRTISKSSVLDIWDYKTNIIDYDSTSIDAYTKEVKHNNRFMFDPVSHLEDCNYNHYCLQLSTYAYMSEECNSNVKIGKMGIINILPNDDNEEDVTFIPVPYLRREVQDIFEYLEEKRYADIILSKQQE